MEQALAIASLVLFAALVVAFFVVLNRAGRVVADTRVEDAFRRDAAALADRAVEHIGEACAQIDRVRRRLDAPDTLEEILPPAMEALDGLATEAAALTPPAALRPVPDPPGRRDRPGGAGGGDTSSTAGSSWASRPGGHASWRARPSIKRGYLNLLHAREALITLAADLRAGGVDTRRWLTDRHPRT